MPMVKDERRQRSTLATRCSQLARNSPSSNRLCFSVSRCCSTLILSTPTRHSQRADLIEVSTGSSRLRRPTSVGEQYRAEPEIQFIDGVVHMTLLLGLPRCLPWEGGGKGTLVSGSDEWGTTARAAIVAVGRERTETAGCVAQATVESKHHRIVLADFRAKVDTCVQDRFLNLVA